MINKFSVLEIFLKLSYRETILPTYETDYQNDIVLIFYILSTKCNIELQIGSFILLIVRI